MAAKLQITEAFAVSHEGLDRNYSVGDLVSITEGKKWPGGWEPRSRNGFVRLVAEEEEEDKASVKKDEKK